MNNTFRFARLAALSALSLLPALAACTITTTPGSTVGPDGGIAEACSAVGKGTLTVTVNGLPSGSLAAASVDSASTKRAVTATSSESAAAGTYTVTAKDVVVADTIVRAVYRPTVDVASPCVRDGATTNVAVNYTLLPSSHALWVTNANSTAEVLGFRADDIRTTGAPAAAVSSRLDIPNDLAFDQEGNMWALAGAVGENKLVRIPASALVSGTLTADRTLTSPAFNEGAPGVGALAFDAAGNAWVSTPAAGKILRIAKESLAASGAITPSVAISNLQAPGSLAFDKDGNLWIAESAGNRVAEFVASRLAAPTTTAADITIFSAPHQAPSGLAFDGSNQLWVNYNGGLIARYTAAERAVSGNVTTNVQITLDVGALAEGLAVDESGGLWFAFSAGKIARLSPDQLGTTSSATPSTILTSASVGYAVRPVFYPAPANVPVFGKPVL